ncbi:MAG TPA: trehalase-like domain-containing protein, partial [Polyangiaceae bacterium]|nr:trehalase-like domain-containing protein [Polyangiaceae bacterium]
MSCPIEDYALIGDCQSAALVSRSGSIDWLCLPRFDSDACFSALLGEPEHGRWLLAPAEAPHETTRRYLPGTLVLETRHETSEGVVLVVDFMPTRGEHADVVRLVVGESGRVRMKMELVLRLGFGSAVPWVHRVGDEIEAVVGPDRFRLQTAVETRGADLTTVSDFEVTAGQRVSFVLSWSLSHVKLPAARLDVEQALRETQAFWLDWSKSFALAGPYAEHARRSLITLKALTYAPTGGIVAAPTTSLPEAIGGAR